MGSAKALSLLIMGPQRSTALVSPFTFHRVTGHELCVCPLGTVPGLSFFPHFSGRFAGLVESKKAGLDHEVVTLDDSQAYLVDGEHRELLSG